MPEEYVNESLAVDQDANAMVVRCAICNDYGPKRIDADEYDSEKEVVSQAKRQLGSHYSQKHADEDGGQGGSTDGKGGSTSAQQPSQPQGGNPQQQAPQQTQPKNSPNQPEGQGGYGGEANERELIYRRGKEGLLEIKKERLKDWLQEANGVGGQTESRIMKVFERNESVNSNPYSLYNILEEETSASGSYINTIVDDVFEPERKHEDILESTGYTPFFRRSGGGSQFSNQQQGIGMQQQGYVQGGNQGYQQGGGMRGQQQQQQSTQQTNQVREEKDLSKEEVAQMITHGINTAKEQSEENPIRDGLSDATDEALREMAGNVGSMAGTANRVFETALMSYAQENPDMIIENMDILQNLLGAAEDTDDSKQQRRQAPNEKRVDDAISQISSGGMGNGNMAGTHQQVNQQPTQQQRQPQPQTNTQPDVGPQNSGFQPDNSVPDSVSDNNPTTDEEPVDDTVSEDSTTDENNETADETNEKPPEKMPRPSGNQDTDAEPSNEDEAFDELFGDME